MKDNQINDTQPNTGNYRILKRNSGLKGSVTVPGDKSISHRAVMLGSIAKGTTEITHFLEGADCLATIQCFQSMGIVIQVSQDKVLVHGRGLHGLRAPAQALYTGNSGTTTRLISGILSGQDFSSTLIGDESLNSRPMGRIMDPLRAMGANITSIHKNHCAPLHMNPSKLRGIHYSSKVASAQVKSAILLAGLYAEGESSVTEPALSRNHTELMLKGFGADISSETMLDGMAKASIRPCRELYSQPVTVPGDISSAAYFIAAALLVQGSELLIRNVGVNATRAGILNVCRDMGAEIHFENKRDISGEPCADLIVRSSPLHGTIIEGAAIPTLIDEIPVIAVLAAFADGLTIIRDAAELKVKETDRIAAVTHNLRAMGVKVTPTEDGMVIEGGNLVHGAVINAFLDHRIAMAFAVAGLAADGETTIRGSHCVDVSYPDFFHTLNKI